MAMGSSEKNEYIPDYEIIQRGKWKVILIKEDINSEFDYSWLKSVTGELCKKGFTKVAIRFDHKTYLFSKLISVLLGCSKVMRKNGGKVAIVAPLPHVVETLKATRLYKTHISVFKKESDLGELV
ncbi:MAG: hypothetical protein GF350_04825 [Chitinivibrionales bacterium]|nr:hypothetical protein [Chitinivibrionales bacterium]